MGYIVSHPPFSNVYKVILRRLFHVVGTVSPFCESVLTPSTSTSLETSVVTTCPRCHVNIAPDDIDEHHHLFHERMYDIAPPNIREFHTSVVHPAGLSAGLDLIPPVTARSDLAWSWSSGLSDGTHLYRIQMRPLEVHFESGNPVHKTRRVYVETLHYYLWYMCWLVTCVKYLFA